MRGFLLRVNRRVSEIKRFSFIAGKSCFSVSLLVTQWAWTAQGQQGGAGGTGLTQERREGSDTHWDAVISKNHYPQCEGQTEHMARGLGQRQGTPHVHRALGRKGKPEARRLFSRTALGRPFEDVHQLHPDWPEPELGRNKYLRRSPHLRAAFLKQHTTRSHVGAGAYSGCCRVRFVLVCCGFITTLSANLLPFALTLHLPIGSGGYKARGSLKH